MIRSSFFMLLLAISCMSCKRPKHVKTTKTTTGKKIELSAYPLAVGRMWVYDNGDTLRVVSDTVINGINAFKVTQKNAGYTNLFYCANRSDGLYLLAADTRVVQSLVEPAYETYDTLRVLETPVRYTSLPVALDKKWNANVPGQPNMERMWTDYTSVTTPAGTFDCVKLAAGRFDEYYSEKGIVMKADRVQCLVAPCPEMLTKLIYVNF